MAFPKLASRLVMTLAAVATVAALSALSALRTAAQTNKPQPQGIVCVDVMYTIQAGHEKEAEDDLRQLADATHKEPGNVLYVIHRSVDDPRKFLIYEQYRSQAAMETHLATDYFRRYSVEGLRKIAESRIAGTYRPF